jgi:hypothetical protein
LAAEIMAILLKPFCQCKVINIFSGKTGPQIVWLEAIARHLMSLNCQLLTSWIYLLDFDVKF